MKNRMKKGVISILTVAFFSVNTLPVFADAPRFGIDVRNSRQIADSFTDTSFPFVEDWETDLGGKVASQPIIVGDFVYVQAGTDLLKITLKSGEIVDRIKDITKHELPSGSSPTFAHTAYGKRIYQATRDHLLWAIDVDDFRLAWKKPLIISSDKYGESYKKRYRITASPFVYSNHNGTFIAIGSGNGDKTGKMPQHADNGFFLIKDYGIAGRAIFDTRINEGEVTGSPIIHNNMIVGTINSRDQESYLIRYLPNKEKLASLRCKVDAGVPGSPACEGDFVYVADLKGCLYKYENKSELEIGRKWKNPTLPGDFDTVRPANTYNLMSPCIGNQYVYLPLQHYNSKSYSGSGAVIAVNKETGYTHAVRTFDNPVKANLLYWQPQSDQAESYLFVYESNGTVWVLDGQTLAPISWYQDKDGKIKETLNISGLAQGSTSPEMVIGNSYLLIVDGAGILRAYRGKKPINFKAIDLKPVEDKEYRVGDQLEFFFTAENTSLKDYPDIPVTLTTPDEKVLDCGQIALKAGEKTTFKLPHLLQVPRLGNIYKATINPEGHMIEILEEIKPRSDNTAVHELNKRVNDIEIVSLSLPTKTAVQKAVTIKTKIKNNSTKDVKNVVIKWMADAQEIRQETLDLAKDESKTFSFTWRAPKQAAIVNIAAIVDPERILDEENYENNFKHKYITVNEFVKRSCKDTLENASWTVTYWVKTEDGSYPVRVTYYESLSAVAQLNTKQGIPTDPNNPKKSDRESRGSWEIIPYAQEQSKKLRKLVDPNKITRAGYYFELTVETLYTNDWEEKVPSGATRIGGEFSGPSQVAIEVYDSAGYFKKEIGLTCLPGSAKGKGKATWVLPWLMPYKLGTGEVIHERKYYTSPDDKDGKYRIVIRVEYAGRNGLYTCLTEEMEIWGSMYDDLVNVPLPKNYDGDYVPQSPRRQS